MARITNYERYAEALAFLRESADAIDQAHSVLIDIGLDDVSIRQGTGYADVRQLSNQVSDMLREMETAECNDCGHALSKHADRYGCEHERGDVPVTGADGHSIDVASGPCGCEWGNTAAGRERKAA